MKRVETGPDRLLFLLPILVFVMGLFFLYSASWREGMTVNHNLLVVRQIFWMTLACLVTYALQRIHYQRLNEIVWPFYGLVIVLLVLVLFAPSRLGAHRWFQIGFFNLQPSEFAKIAVILAVASCLKNRRFQTAPTWQRLLPFVLCAVPLALILKARGKRSGCRRGEERSCPDTRLET